LATNFSNLPVSQCTNSGGSVPRVYVVTDSAVVIDPNAVERLNITVVPLTVQIDQKEYQDGVDLDHEELLLRMSRDRARPEIVGPKAGQFQRVYGRLTRHTDQIISLHSSASLSFVCREAQRAAHGFLGRRDIVVVDSETFSLGLGILVQEAAELAQQSVPLEEIVRQIRGMLRHIYVALTTDTLDYLGHSGLISPSQTILGTMLDNKPFLAIERGEIIPMEKIIGRERAIGKLADFANEFPRIEQVAILQSTPYPTEETKWLRDDMEIIAQGRDVPLLLYGPLLASHVGPDAIGLLVYEGYGSPRSVFT
jgi:DegV family protein with EDD domain